MATINGTQKRKAKAYMHTKQVHVHKTQKKNTHTNDDV